MKWNFVLFFYYFFLTDISCFVFDWAQNTNHIDTSLFPSKIYITQWIILRTGLLSQENSLLVKFWGLILREGSSSGVVWWMKNRTRQFTPEEKRSKIRVRQFYSGANLLGSIFRVLHRRAAHCMWILTLAGCRIVWMSGAGTTLVKPTRYWNNI